MRVNKLTALVALGAILIGTTACTTFEKGLSESVAVYTYPSGAEAYVSGELVGTTPLTIDLARKVPHEITLVKEGYQTTSQTVVPIANDRGQGLVRFGLAEDTGLYTSLEPNPVEVQLLPAILPQVPGADRYSEMSAIIIQLDQQREAGQLDPVEHRYMTEKVIEFYSR